jgi:hypothetical protein
VSSCQWCGKKLQVQRRGRPQKYCGDRCRLEAWRGKQTGLRGPKRPKREPRPEPVGTAPLIANVEAWRRYVLRTWECDHVERALLQAACEAWTDYQCARETLARGGFSVEDVPGRPRLRPAFEVMERSRRAFLAVVRAMKLESAGSPGDFSEDADGETEK